MSVDTQTGVTVVSGATGGGAATLAQTGDPVVMAVLAGAAAIIIVGVVTRLSQRSR